MDFNWMTLLIIIGSFLAVMLSCFAFYVKMHQKVEQGRAMIVTSMKDKPDVTTTGRIVIPFLHKAEYMDIGIKRLEVKRGGKNGLICKDKIRADIEVVFYVGVNPEEEDILHVAQKIGCERASTSETLKDLFDAKFSEALKTVGTRMDFEELMSNRDQFKNEILNVIGEDLNGYVLDDVAIDHVDQTPLTNMDENNIFDAEGIRKITEQTAEKNIKTAEIREREETEIKQKQVEADEQRMELDRQKALAEERTNREIAVAKSEEKKTSDMKALQDMQEVEKVRLKNEEELEKERVNKEREVEKAQTNKSRDLAVAQEEMRRETEAERVKTEKLISLQELEKEQEEEDRKRGVAETRAQTVKVERSIAEEEEATKDLRNKSAADRVRLTEVTAAESKAEAEQVENVKRAEAAKQVSEHQIQEAKNKAQSERELADSKIKMAEAIQAEEAASGLARAEVLRAEGLASAEVAEKQGLAEAAVTKEKGLAEAAATEATLKAMNAGGEEARNMEITQQLLTIYRDVSMKQAEVEGEALKANASVMSGALQGADVQLFGNNGEFMDSIQSAVVRGKAANAAMNSNELLASLKADLVDGDGTKVNELLKSLGEATDNPAITALLATNAAKGGNADVVSTLLGVLGANKAS